MKKLLTLTIAIILMIPQQGYALRPTAAGIEAFPKEAQRRAQKTLGRILGKGSRRYSRADLDSVNRIASDIAGSVIQQAQLAGKCPEALLPDRIQRPLQENNILGISEGSLKEVARLVKQYGGNETQGLFMRCLNIASRFYDTQRQDEKLSLTEQRKACESNLIICSAALVFEPDSKRTQLEYAFALFHAGRPEECEKVLAGVTKVARRPSRKAAALAGSAKLEIARRFYWDLAPALDAERFDKALSLMEEIDRETSEAKSILDKVVGPYLAGDTEDTRQIPRAFGGLAAIERLLSDTYYLASSSNLARAKEYSLSALTHISRALYHSTQALSVDNINAKSMKGPLRICRECLTRLTETPGLVELHLVNERAIKALAKALDGLKAISVKTNNSAYRGIKAQIRNIKETAARLIEDIDRKVDFAQKVREAAIEGVINVALGGKDYTSIREFYSAVLNEHVLQNIKSREATTPTVIFVQLTDGCLKCDLTDLLLIRAYLHSKAEDPDSIAEYAQAKYPRSITVQEVIHRFRKAIFAACGLTLTSRPVAKKRIKEKEVPHKPVLQQYSDGDIAKCIELDARRIQELRELYHRICPWITPERAAELGSLVDKIETGVAGFRTKGKGYLEKVSLGGTIRRKEKQAALDSLKEIRAGKNGYEHKRKQLFSLLGRDRARIIDRIQQGLDEIQQHRNSVGSLKSEFGFMYLDIIGRRLEQAQVAMQELLNDKSEHYLSKERFDSLLTEADDIVQAEVVCVKDNIIQLREINTTLKQAEAAAAPLSDLLEDDLLAGVTAKVEDARQGFRNSAFSGDFTQRSSDMLHDAQKTLQHVERLVDLAERKERFLSRCEGVKMDVNVNRPLLPEEPIMEKEKNALKHIRAALEVLRQLNEQALTYDNLPDYEQDLASAEGEASPHLDKAEGLIAQLHKRKCELLKSEMEHVRDALNLLKAWFEERILPKYQGEPANHANEAQEAFNDLDRIFTQLIAQLEKEHTEREASVAMFTIAEYLFSKLFEKLINSILFERIAHGGFIDEEIKHVMDNRSFAVPGALSPTVGWTNKVILADPYGYPLTFYIACFDKDIRFLSGQTDMIAKKPGIRRAISAAEDAFGKWRSLDENDSLPLPLAEILLSIQKTLEYYVRLDTDYHDELEFVDAYSAFEKIYDIAFTKILECYRESPNLVNDRFFRPGYGGRTEDMRQARWLTLQHLLQQCGVLPNEEEQEVADKEEASSDLVSNLEKELFSPESEEFGVLPVLRAQGEERYKDEEASPIATKTYDTIKVEGPLRRAVFGSPTYLTALEECA